MQTITLDLIPQKEKPIVKLSQYDNDRQVRFMLEENGEPYTLVGTETVEVNIRKPDRNIVVLAPTIGANAYVDVLFTEQSAACYGEAFGELSIKSGETVIGTCNFIIDVEISPIYGGISSETEINNLETQIEEIITEVLSDDYYTKTQTDTLLNAKANASDVYTKTQTDTLLSAKANTSDVYTKTEVDNIILDIMPVDTATGPIATFNTELAVPLVNVSCDVKATGGNGTPDSPIPINGYTEANITRCGVNLFMPDFSKWSSAGPYLKMSKFTPEGISLLMSFKNKDTSVDISGCYFGFVDTNYESGTATDLRWCIQNGIVSNVTNNTSVNHPDIICNSLLLYPANETTFNKIMSRYDIQIELGNTASEYHTNNGQTYTVAFGRTVYGGVLDVTRGKLTVTHSKASFSDRNFDQYSTGFFATSFNSKPNGTGLCEIYTIAVDKSYANAPDNSMQFRGNQILIKDTSCADVTALIAKVGSHEFTYELATPFDIDLTPEVISAVVGTNNVYSDTNGDTTVQYKDSIQHYIDNH